MVEIGRWPASVEGWLSRAVAISEGKGRTGVGDGPGLGPGVVPGLEPAPSVMALLLVRRSGGTSPSPADDILQDASV